QATDAATDAVAEEASDAAAAVEDAATDATAAVDQATERALDELLTPEGFDADAMLVRVDESSLDTETKTGLRAAIEDARDNPDAVSDLIDELKVQFEVE
ncbi:MAG: hypothetical protein AAGF30_10150, partial [Pseudomonadota bacterium]